MFVYHTTAATVAVGFNVAAGMYWEKSPYWRKIQHLGCAGGSAAGDSIFEIYYGNVKVGEITNVATGLVTDLCTFAHTSQVMLPPNQSLAVICKDAAPAAVNFMFDILEVTNK